MNAWNTQNEQSSPEVPVLIPRDEAITLIKRQAKESGYGSKVNVKYNNVDIMESDLPAMVDMSLVRLSAVLNNA
jgi:hypothetical protein